MDVDSEAWGGHGRGGQAGWRDTKGGAWQSGHSGERLWRRERVEGGRARLDDGRGGKTGRSLSGRDEGLIRQRRATGGRRPGSTHDRGIWERKRLYDCHMGRCFSRGPGRWGRRGARGRPALPSSIYRPRPPTPAGSLMTPPSRPPSLLPPSPPSPRRPSPAPRPHRADAMTHGLRASRTHHRRHPHRRTLLRPVSPTPLLPRDLNQPSSHIACPARLLRKPSSTSDSMGATTTVATPSS